jgi:ribose transport system substrate-binding protein
VRTLRRFVVMSVVLWVPVLWGCRQEADTSESGQPAGGARKTKIALIMKARTNPFFQRMAEGAETAARRNNIDLVILSIDKETDFDKQAGHVESAVAQGVQAILIAPGDSKAIVAPLLEAQVRKIPILNLDNRIDAATAKAQGLNVLTFIGPNNEEGAEKATDCLIRLIGGEGDVAILEGIRGVDNGEARKRGFEKAVRKTGGKVKIAASESAEWETDPARSKMEGILNRCPNLKGVFCANDMMALGAVAAIEAGGKGGKIFVTAYDNLDAARQAIKAGRMHGTIEQHPYKMGEQGVELALKVLAGQTIPKEVSIPTDLVTREDVEKNR